MYFCAYTILYFFFFFFFNDTATTEIYTLSLHDALPICVVYSSTINITVATTSAAQHSVDLNWIDTGTATAGFNVRSEEHTSELQSRFDLVCRLLLEKKKIKRTRSTMRTSISATWCCLCA